MESKTFRIALNCAQKPNRGLAYENDLTVYNTLSPGLQDWSTVSTMAKSR